MGRAGVWRLVRDAELSPGRKDEPGAGPRPVEVHLLERNWSDETDAGADDERGEGQEPAEAQAGSRLSPDHPAAWKGVEREAYLIGERLRAIMAAERKPDGSPYAYRDAAILLRASNVSGDKVAGTRLCSRNYIQLTWAESLRNSRKPSP